jgi:hypothetical protein
LERMSLQMLRSLLYEVHVEVSLGSDSSGAILTNRIDDRWKGRSLLCMFLQFERKGVVKAVVCAVDNMAVDDDRNERADE